jgi:hypothetical protein
VEILSSILGIISLDKDPKFPRSSLLGRFLTHSSILSLGVVSSVVVSSTSLVLIWLPKIFFSALDEYFGNDRMKLPHVATSKTFFYHGSNP